MIYWKRLILLLPVMLIASCVSAVRLSPAVSETAVGDAATAASYRSSSTDTPEEVTLPPVVTERSVHSPFVPCQQTAEPLPLVDAPPLPGSIFLSRAGKLYLLKGADHRIEERMDYSQLDTPNLIGITAKSRWLAFASIPPLSKRPLRIRLASPGEADSINAVDLPFPPVSGREDAYYWGLFAWLNQDTLIFSVTDGEKHATLTYNPFKKEIQNMTEGLPNRRGNANISVSPDQSRVLYFTNDNQVVLWDRVGQKELWRKDGSSTYLVDTAPYLEPTKWSFDSQYFLTLGSNENNVTWVFDRDANLIDQNQGWNTAFSPNNRYLSYLAKSKVEAGKNGLFIFDLQQKLTSEVCRFAPDEVSLSGNILENVNGDMVWSPDSRFIIYGTGDDLTDEKNGLRLFDTLTGKIYLLAEGKSVVLAGWSEWKDWK